MNRTFLLVGPPGSGKGEQAKRLAAKSGMTHIAMGSLIRHYCDTPREGNICEQIEKDYKSGVPQTDEMSLKILHDELSHTDVSNGVIFDAFPLSMGEAHTLPDILKNFSLADPVVIHIDVDEHTAVTRISERKICSACGRTFTPHTTPHDTDVCDACGGALIQREDDTAEIVRRRYRDYEGRIRLLLAYYTELGYPIISYTSGEQGPQEDFEVLCKKLAEIGITL